MKVWRDRESIFEVESPPRGAEIRPDTPSKKVSTRHSCRAPAAASEGGDGLGEGSARGTERSAMERRPYR